MSGKHSPILAYPTPGALVQMLQSSDEGDRIGTLVGGGGIMTGQTNWKRTPTLGWTVVLLLAACAGSDPAAPTPEAGPPRAYALGFTDFPYDATAAAFDEAYRVIGQDADMVVEHFDGGVPWQPALDGTAYPVPFQNDIDGKVSRVPDGHTVYLAVTPIAFGRDGLALDQRDAANQPLDAPWDTLGFADAPVQTAFLHHCERMIGAFQPDYFAYAIEANILASKSSEQWSDFVVLARYVYTHLKTTHPDLPIFATLQADYFNADRIGQTAALDSLWAYTDIVAVSAYPYAAPVNAPSEIGADYFSALAGLAPDKPFAVSETGWPAEPIGTPYPIVIPGSPEAQMEYVQRVLTECDARTTAFACWFFTRDFDDMWDRQLSTLPDAPIFRLWKDDGLYAGDGSERPALQPWRAALARPRP